MWRWVWVWGGKFILSSKPKPFVYTRCPITSNLLRSQSRVILEVPDDETILNDNTPVIARSHAKWRDNAAIPTMRSLHMGKFQSPPPRSSPPSTGSGPRAESRCLNRGRKNKEVDYFRVRDDPSSSFGLRRGRQKPLDSGSSLAFTLPSIPSPQGRGRVWNGLLFGSARNDGYGGFHLDT